MVQVNHGIGDGPGVNVNNADPSSGPSNRPKYKIHTIQGITPNKPSVPKFTARHSEQMDGWTKLKRMEFRFMGRYYEFLVNPEEFQQIEPNRGTITQTKGGAFLDDFGGGVQTISMKGTTGFKAGTGHGERGFLKFKELRDMIREYYFKLAPGTNMTSSQQHLVLHNYTDAEHWVVYPNQFKLMRSVSRPLLYAYDIQLTCLRPADQPAQKAVTFSSTLGRNVVE